MKRILLFAAILALILGLAACKSSSEKAAEKAIEVASGGKTKADVSEGGIEAKTETEEGTVSWSAGNKAKIPADFPSDIYVYEGAAIEMAMDSPEAFTISLKTDDPVPNVADTYQKKLEAAGWTKQNLMDMGEHRILTYGKGDRVAQVSVVNEDGATRIGITASRMKE